MSEISGDCSDSECSDRPYHRLDIIKERDTSSQFNEKQRDALVTALSAAYKFLRSYGFSLGKNSLFIVKASEYKAVDDFVWENPLVIPSDFIDESIADGVFLRADGFPGKTYDDLELLLKYELIYRMQKDLNVKEHAPAFFRYGSAAYIVKSHLNAAIVRICSHRQTVDKVIRWEINTPPSSRAYRVIGYRITKWLIEEKGLPPLPELYREIGMNSFKATMDRYAITLDNMKAIMRPPDASCTL